MVRKRNLLVSKIPVALIIASGVLLGTIDIVAAFLDYYFSSGKNPLLILNYIASGVFGHQAYKGGVETRLWGLLFHYLIALGFTGLFYWLYVRFKSCQNYPLIFAVCYSVFMWFITTVILIPISQVTPIVSIRFLNVVKAIIILFITISLPLIILAKNYLKQMGGSTQ